MNISADWLDNIPSQPAGPCSIVIFGAAGDLTQRLLIPALYNLLRSNLLSPEFAIVGVGRTEMSTEDFRSKMRQAIHEFATVEVDDRLWQTFEDRCYYLAGDFQDPQTYQQLQGLLGQVDTECGTQGNYLYYLATASSFFCDIVARLGEIGLTTEENGQWRRAIVEKPFGRDLESARALNQSISKVLQESQIYRIDHYLGKETVQNMLVFRFGNGIFEHIWNHHYIDHVQITVAETVGVENRGGFYEGVGALRDMMQNHMFQLLATIGDATLFQRSDNVELGWSIVAPILDVWSALPPRNFANYAAGTSWGPAAADALLARDSRKWREIK